MTAPARSRSKGVDPRARELAQDMARQAGLSLEQWLDEIAHADQPDPHAEELAKVAEALERLTSRIESAEHRSMLAINGIDQSVVGLLSRLEGAERGQTEAAERVDDQLARVRAEQAEAVDRLEDRLRGVSAEQARAEERLARVEAEAASPRPLEAVRTLETAMGKVAAHVYDSDHRTGEALEGLRGEFGQLSQRMEQVDARAAELARAPDKQIDDVVGRIVRRIEQAEARTSTAIGSLETSFADLDQRLRNTELRNDGPEQRFEQLAAELARSFEETRAELAASLAASAGGRRLEALERSLKEMSEHVTSAERRSAHAIESMGHEVLRMADTLGRRMEGVETRSAVAIQQVGGDVARIADTVETRFRRADQMQAEALDKLGAEISRISERLADRIASSERRAAQAMDDVGEQVARVTERIGQRSERSSDEIADRIRQSEERTARLLEEAREKIDQRLAETQRRLAEQAPARAFADAELFSAPDLPPGPFGPEAFAADDFDEPAPMRRRASPVEEPPASPSRAATFNEPPPSAPRAQAAPAPAFEPAPASDPASAFGSGPAFEPEPALDPESFAAVADLVEEEPDPVPTFRRPPAPEPVATPAAQPARAASARELIEQARAAARAAHTDERPQPKAGKSLFSGFSLGKRKKDGTGARKAVMMSAAAAALGVSAFGYTMIAAQSVKGGKDKGERPIDATAQPPAGAGQMAAVAVGPQVALPPGLVEPASAPNAQVNALYMDAVRRIEAKEYRAVADLRRAADAGHPQAQFYLAKLYEGGEAGLRKDLAEARRWTERAAQNGDRKAMHNLGLYYFEGTGGPKNATAAAQWFRRASDLGLLDSQFNLARLYEEGFGVGQNPAEAYKWYLIGARSGDGESRAAAERVKARLSPQARAAAERAAAVFRPDLSAAAPSAVAAAPAAASPNANFTLAQRALSRLGYYRGPQDGAPSPALQLAIQAYQRENGLPPTGAVDGALAARFAVVAG